MGLGSSEPEIHAMAVTPSGNVLAVGSVVVNAPPAREPAAR